MEGGDPGAEPASGVGARRRAQSPPRRRRGRGGPADRPRSGRGPAGVAPEGRRRRRVLALHRSARRDHHPERSLRGGRLLPRARMDVERGSVGPGPRHRARRLPHPARAAPGNGRADRPRALSLAPSLARGNPRSGDGTGGLVRRPLRVRGPDPHAGRIDRGGGGRVAAAPVRPRGALVGARSGNEHHPHLGPGGDGRRRRRSRAPRGQRPRRSAPGPARPGAPHLPRAGHLRPDPRAAQRGRADRGRRGRQGHPRRARPRQVAGGP